jgi:hypothetical protein
MLPIVTISVVFLSIGALACGAERISRNTHTRTRTEFSVFDIPSTQDDILPKNVVSSLQEEGLNGKVSTRRVVASSDPGWLVLASDGSLCLVRLIYPLIPAIEGPSLPITSKTCASEEQARSGQLVETESLTTEVGEPSRNVVVGIVPDGVATVKVSEANGQVVVVHVTRNAYEAVTANPRSVEFVSGGHWYVVQVRSFNGNKARYQPPPKESF